MKYTLRIFCILLIILFSNKLQAQLNYKSGIVISIQNDTLKGKIRDGGGIRNSKVCVFKPENNGDKIRYFPGDIKSYRFNGDKYYSSKNFLVKGAYKNVFSEVLLEGEYSLYYSTKNKQLRFAIQKKDEALIGLPNYEKKLNTYNGSHTLSMRKGNYYTDYSFVDTLATLFKDSPKVMNVVETTDYTEEAIINLTKIYLKEKCKGSDCLNYEKDLSKTRLRYGVFSGFQISQFLISNTYFKSEYSTTIPIGIFLNIPVPQLSERLFFEIDMILSKFNLGSTRIDFNSIYSPTYFQFTSTSLDLPVLFKYEFVSHRLSPSLAFGKEFGMVLKSKFEENDHLRDGLHQSQTGKWISELGINYDVSEYFSLFAKLRYKSFSGYNYGIYRPNLFALYIGVKF